MTEEPVEAPAGSPQTEQSSVTRITTMLESFRIDRLRGALWVVTFGLIAALLYIGWLYVGTFIMGVFVYYVTRPVFRRIHTRVGSRTLAVGVTLLVAAVPLLVIVGWTLRFWSIR